MTGAKNQFSIEAFFPQPNFMSGGIPAGPAPLPHPPIVSNGPPLAQFASASLNRPATNDLRFDSSQVETQTAAARHLEQMLKSFDWFSLTEINRTQTSNFSQLLFDDRLLGKSVPGYFRPLDQHDYVFNLTLHLGTSHINYGIMRDHGLIAESRNDLRSMLWFHFSASQARSLGTSVVRGRLEMMARVAEIEDSRQFWDLLLRYFDEVVESFSAARGLSHIEKHDLQSLLVVRALEQQNLDAIVMNHPAAGWKSLLLLNAEVMTLEFNQ